MITDEMLKQVIEGAGKYQDVVVHQAADLIDQTLAFFIFDSIVSVIQAGVVFVLLYIVRRAFNFFIREEEEEVAHCLKEADRCRAELEKAESREEYARRWRDSAQRHKGTAAALKGWRLFASVVATVIFLVFSVPHLRQVGKIMVAPKLFMLEKAAELVKEPKKEEKP